MTDPTAPEPLAPDVVDELLSALADGEFDAAARDLGFTPDEARARLAATTGADARAAALRDASTQIGEEVPLDEMTRRRLVARATLPAREAARTRWSRSLMTGAGIAAAIVVVLGLVAVMVRSSSSDDDSASNAGGGLAASETTAGAAADVAGGINNDEQLRRYVEQIEARHEAANSASKADAPSTPPAAPFEGSPPLSTDSASRATAQYSATTCAAKLSQDLGIKTVPISLEGTRYRGKRAFVAVYDEGDRTVGVLYDRRECRIIISSSQFAK